ncbi:serine hydrolase [Peribacillus sp. SCS-37]|uniref:serine hydrolase n=1 Tax=Paraperibacillus esterisolvens TaxID=3115296 RepID=UPI003906A52C
MSMRKNSMADFESCLQAASEQLDGRIAAYIEIDGAAAVWNGGAVMPAASLIKLPIMLAAFRLNEQGRLPLGRRMNIPLSQKAGGAGVLHILSEETSLSVKDLLALMIIVSDNTAANMMIDLIGFHEINKVILEAGMKDTVLSRKMMDWDAINEGRDNFTTAQDIVICLKAFSEGSYLSQESSAAAMKIMQSQQFIDKLPSGMDLEKVHAANKTGELPGAEHDCGIFSYGDRRAYAAVLTDRLQKKEDGREAISRIGKVLYQHITS